MCHSALSCSEQDFDGSRCLLRFSLLLQRPSKKGNEGLAVVKGCKLVALHHSYQSMLPQHVPILQAHTQKYVLVAGEIWHPLCAWCIGLLIFCAKIYMCHLYMKEQKLERRVAGSAALLGAAAAAESALRACGIVRPANMTSS